MYSLVRLLPVRDLVLRQAPALATSFVVAELFYKFHSFTLECIAFLATWFVLDGLSRFVLGDGSRQEGGRS